MFLPLNRGERTDLLLSILFNKFQPVPCSSQGSSEVSVFMRKLYRFYTIRPPSTPSFSPIFPLIVMVIDSIMRDQNGQFNWWKRDHQMGRRGGLHISDMNDFPSPKAYGIHYGTWRNLSKTFSVSSSIIMWPDRLAWLGIHRYWKSVPTLLQSAFHFCCTCHESYYKR